MKLVFNSSLPRSGSTLFQNVLAQNPRFYCSATSGVVELLCAGRRAFTHSVEFKASDPTTMKTGWFGYCKAAIEGFYSAITDCPIACDKSRGWIYALDWLNQFYPNPKVIVCLRDIRSLMVSMEKLHRKNAYLADGLDKPGEMQFVTIDQRITQWLNTPPVGLSLNRLRDALDKGYAPKLHFVIYEKFVANPQEEMNKVYDYLEEDRFIHDFTNVEQRTHENDAVHGIYGEHTIRQQVSDNRSDWDAVLGQEISNQIVQRHWWFYSLFYPEVYETVNLSDMMRKAVNG